MVFTLHAFLNTDNEQIYVKKKSSVFIPLYWHTIATSSCTEELKCSLVSEYPIITGEVWIVKLTTVLVHAQYCK